MVAPTRGLLVAGGGRSDGGVAGQDLGDGLVVGVEPIDAGAVQAQRAEGAVTDVHLVRTAVDSKNHREVMHFGRVARRALCMNARPLVAHGVDDAHSVEASCSQAEILAHVLAYAARRRALVRVELQGWPRLAAAEDDAVLGERRRCGRVGPTCRCPVSWPKKPICADTTANAAAISISH